MLNKSDNKITKSRFIPYLIIVTLAFVVSISGCSTTKIANSKWAKDRMQIISAGHTGCMPEANEINAISVNLWTATCKGKRYLCSAFGNSEYPSYACTVAVE